MPRHAAAASRARSSESPNRAAISRVTVSAPYAKERISPATSRSGVDLARRSSAGREGSPSKSTMIRSLSATSTCPRW